MWLNRISDIVALVIVILLPSRLLHFQFLGIHWVDLILSLRDSSMNSFDSYFQVLSYLALMGITLDLMLSLYLTLKSSVIYCWLRGVRQCENDTRTNPIRRWGLVFSEPSAPSILNTSSTLGKRLNPCRLGSFGDPRLSLSFVRWLSALAV